MHARADGWVGEEADAPCCAIGYAQLRMCALASVRKW